MVVPDSRQKSWPVVALCFRPFDAEHAVFDAAAGDRTGPRRGDQPAQAIVEGEPALRRASRADWPGPAGCGRHQRRREPTAAPSDVAVAARPRQPDVAGAERVRQVEQHRRLPKASCAATARRGRPASCGRIRSGAGCCAPSSADRFQQGLGRRRRLNVQRAQHSRRVAAEAAVAPQDVIQRIRRARYLGGPGAGAVLTDRPRARAPSASTAGTMR